MKYLFNILSWLVIFVLFSGCSDESANSKHSLSSVRQDIKAGELLPRQQFDRRDNLNVRLQIYTFYISEEGYAELSEVFDKAGQLGFEYSDEKDFIANGLVTTGGDMLAWNFLSKVLTKEQAKVASHMSLQTLEGMSEDVFISRLEAPSNVHYSSGGVVSGLSLVPGEFVLRLKPEPLIGLRRATRLDIETVYKTSIAERGKFGEFVFEAVDCRVRLSPGQFILMGPRVWKADYDFLGDKMFFPERSVSAVHFCVIVCDSILE